MRFKKVTAVLLALAVAAVPVAPVFAEGDEYVTPVTLPAQVSPIELDSNSYWHVDGIRIDNVVRVLDSGTVPGVVGPFMVARVVAEVLGLNFGWAQNENGVVTSFFYNDEVRMEFTHGSAMAWVERNGVRTPTQIFIQGVVPAQMQVIEGRTFVPVQFFDAIFPGSVVWNDLDQSVFLFPLQ